MITPQKLSLTHQIQPPRTPPPPTGEKPPLLVLLHGVGSNEYDLLGLAPHLDGRFLILSARAPVTLGPSAFGWYPVQFTPQGPIGDTVAAENSRNAILTFLGEAVEAYGADPERVFLAGFSQGAIMSLYVALTAPKQVAGVVLMSGRLLPEAWESRASDDKLRGLPLLAVHGTRDTVLPIQNGREIERELSKVPVTLTYKEYDMAHEVSSESLALVQSWLTDRLGKQ